MMRRYTVLYAAWAMAWIAAGCQDTHVPGATEYGMEHSAQRRSVEEDSRPRLALCFAPGTPRERMDAAIERARQHMPQISIGTFEFDDADRWSETSTSGPGLTQGEPTVLTWSIVPDGTFIEGYVGEPASGSDLIAFLDGIYPNSETDLRNKPWFTLFEQVFQRWSELSGNTYIYEPNDDGSPWGCKGPPFNCLKLDIDDGDPGVRGDVRIGGHYVDGNIDVLAYNFFPDVSDMVIDTGEDFYYSTSYNSRGLRNVLMHEHGHGLGLSHVCPVQKTKLMEPIVTIGFDGPQHDDILAVNRGYGDRLEDNDIIGEAVDLPVAGFGVPLSLETLTIDSAVDVDWYSVTVGDSSRLSVAVTPIGETYLSGPQNTDGSCTAGTLFNSLIQSNLDLAIIAPDQSTVLANANTQPAGSAETVDDLLLPDGAATYYISVNGDTDAVQLYDLSVTVTCDLPGDVDGDCAVGLNDIAAFSHLWLADCVQNDCGRANVVADETVNLPDFLPLQQNWLIDLN